MNLLEETFNIALLRIEKDIYKMSEVQISKKESVQYSHISNKDDNDEDEATLLEKAIKMSLCPINYPD